MARSAARRAAPIGMPERLRAAALDPEAHALLRMINLAMPRSTRASSMDGMRRRWRWLALMLGQHVPMASVENRTIAGPGGPLRVRVYRPTAAGGVGVRPGFLWLHGGGFVIGDLGTADSICRGIASRSGAIVVSLDYRLVPEYSLHAGRDDARAALDWMVAEAAALGVDPARLAVGGDSAGGNLAAVLAQDVAAHGGPSLRLQVLVYPATNLHDAFASTDENGRGHLLTVQSMAWIDALIGPGVDRADPRISPALAPRLAGLPPALLISAGFDPIRDDGLAYAARLRRAGVPVQLLHYAGQFHGFVNFDASLHAARDALGRIGAALVDAYAGTTPDRTCEIAADAASLPVNPILDATIAALMTAERWEQWRNGAVDRILGIEPARRPLLAHSWLNPVASTRRWWAEALAPMRVCETFVREANPKA